MLEEAQEEAVLESVFAGYSHDLVPEFVQKPIDTTSGFWYNTSSKFTHKQDIYLQYADVVELVDTLALGASASGREGSSPFIRTRGELIEIPSKWAVF